jgi:TRAP-type mannitol/chloroaromatic compound transport system permease large subunit
VSFSQACALLILPAAFVLMALGWPVAYSLIGGALAMVGLAACVDPTVLVLLSALPTRVLAVMESDLLQALPLFLLLALVLERAGFIRSLMGDLADVFSRGLGGALPAMVLTGMLIAPLLGVAGATLLVMSASALPLLQERGVPPRHAAGALAGVGTFGAAMPPSIVLLLLTDFMRSATVEASGLNPNVSPVSFTSPDLFAALLPSMALIATGFFLVAVVLGRRQARDPAAARPALHLARLLLTAAPLVALLYLVISGRIYVVEAAAMAACLATLVSLASRRLTLAGFGRCLLDTMRHAGLIVLLLIAANTLTLIFRALDGQRWVFDFALGSGMEWHLMALLVMLGIVVLGSCLDAFEIIPIVVPIAVPILIAKGAPPLTVAVLVALAMQAALAMPPAGFALTFAQSLTRGRVKSADLMLGVLPYLAVNLLALAAAFVWLGSR